MAGRPVKLGLIGAGRWGRNCIHTIAALPEMQLTAVASRNPKTAKLVPTKCRIVKNWQEIIAAPDLDGVVVTSPPASHAEILIAAMNAGKATLLEKPAVRSRADVQQVRLRLDASAAIILVEHTHLYHPAFRQLQREAARHGPVRAIRSSAGNLGPYRPDVPLLWDWGPHDLAMCLVLVPGPARVLSARRIDARPVDGGVAESLAIELELDTGVHADIRLSTLTERHRWLAVDFDDCTLVYRDQGTGQLASLPAGANIEAAGVAIPFDERPPLTQAMLDFAEAIRTHNTDRASIDLGLDVVDLIAAIDSRLGAA